MLPTVRPGSFLLALVLGCVAACGTNGLGLAVPGLGSSGTGNGSSTFVSGGVEDDAGCLVQDCTCANGAGGVQRSCNGGAPSACDCTGCAAFQGAKALPAPTCGGDPTGVWMSTSVEIDGAVFRQSNVLSSVPSCPTQVNTVASTGNTPALLLNLTTAGAASLSLTPVEIDYTFQKQCSGLADLPDACGLVVATDGVSTCTDSTCGLCSCESKGLPTSYGSATLQSATWTHSGSQLSVAFFNETFNGSYCVSGNTMTLEDSTGIVYHMARTYVGGAPSDCSTRSATACVDGCTPGHCEGNSNCTIGETQTACLSLAGCIWSDAGCYGSPNGCDWTSQAVPGCLVAPYGTACAGAPPQCGSMSSAACGSAAGCVPFSECEGATADCTRLSDDTCEMALGCFSMFEGGCVADVPVTCADQDREDICSGLGCTWVGCGGEPQPCETYTAAECSAHPGCAPVGGGTEQALVDSGATDSAARGDSAMTPDSAANTDSATSVDSASSDESAAADANPDDTSESATADAAGN